jgi:hypothetical protein
MPFIGGAVAKKDWCPCGPNPAEGRALYTLLLRAVSWNCIAFAGVLLTGAKLFLPPPVLANMFCVLGRCTVEKPIPARLSPEDDR